VLLRRDKTGAQLKVSFSPDEMIDKSQPEEKLQTLKTYDVRNTCLNVLLQVIRRLCFSAGKNIV